MNGSTGAVKKKGQRMSKELNRAEKTAVILSRGPRSPGTMWENDKVQLQPQHEGEIRNPKAEIRKKAEIRDPNTRLRDHGGGEICVGK